MVLRSTTYFVMLRIAIKTARENRHWSFRRLGMYAGIHHTQLSRFESGRGDLEGSQLDRVLEVLGVEVFVAGKSVYNHPPLEEDEAS
jgi:transcriptional regulator with XRE-family HTH domain